MRGKQTGVKLDDGRFRFREAGRNAMTLALEMTLALRMVLAGGVSGAGEAVGGVSKEAAREHLVAGRRRIAGFRCSTAVT